MFKVTFSWTSPLSDCKVPIYTQTSVRNPRRDSGRWGPLNALHRLETFTEFLKLADCAENWRVKHFWIDRQKQKSREEFSNLFLTCCKANQLIEDELRSCFYLKIKETSRCCWSLSRKTNRHKMLKGYNMHILRLSPVPPCMTHLRYRKVSLQANFSY